MSIFNWEKSGPDTHPLHPTHTGRNESDAVSVQQPSQQECNNCQSPFAVSKPAYYCKTCDVSLCNNCSIGAKHPAHAEHQLFKVYNNLQQDGARWRCNFCRKSNAELEDPFRYRCNICDFDMCQKCSRPLAHPLHHHRLVRTDVRRVYRHSGGIWLCDACEHNNGPGNYHPWHCQDCLFDICDNCTEQRYSMIHEQHPLYKADSTVVYQRSNGVWICNRCSRSFTVEIDKYPYHCNECEFDLCQDCMRSTGTLSNYGSNPSSGHRSSSVEAQVRPPNAKAKKRSQLPEVDPVIKKIRSEPSTSGAGHCAIQDTVNEYESHPLLNQSINILPALARQELCLKMNIKRPNIDYQALAARLGLKSDHISLISQKENATEEVLKWAGTRNENTIGRLRNILQEMKRDDCVDIIDDECRRTVNHQCESHPLLNENIDNLPLLARSKLCMKMDILRPSNDYQILAARLGMTSDLIGRISQVEDPTEKILKWAQLRRENTIGRLRKILQEMNRDDCVTIIDDECRGPSRRAIADYTIYNEAYHRALEKGEAVNNRIPIMLVGQDRTGKTSLKKHLLGLPFDVQEPSTNGIEVDMVELTDENAEEPWKRKEVAQFIISEEEATEQVLKQAACLLTQREVEPKKKEEPARPFLQLHATKQYPPSSGNVRELAQGDNSMPPKSHEALPKSLVDDIRSLEKKVGIDETPSVRAIVHDFAGQSLFYDTHYYFLKPQCPYIVVHDLRNPLLDPAQPRFKPKGIDVDRILNNPNLATNLDNFLSWLTVLDKLRESTDKIVSKKFPNLKLPPVLIALTNSDRFEGDIGKVKEKIKRILRERRFENVFIEPYVIDNTSSGLTKDDVRKLRKDLYELCKAILAKQRPVPVRWLQFEATLSKKMVEEKIPYILVEETRKIGEDCKVEDVDAALTFLHHQGVVVHHTGSSVVVLNPVWLMNLFTEVISLPQEDNLNNVRYDELLKKGILMKEYLREREHGELLEEMMLQFGLICRWQHEEGPAFIVPSVAPVMENGKVVEEQLCSSQIAPLFLHFERGFILPGIFTRFLVRIIEELREFVRVQPNLFCNYTLLSLQLPEGKCDVYVIEQLSGIKIGVVPRCLVNQREGGKIAVYLKQVMTKCINGIKEDKELHYRDIDVSLDVKCSACFDETVECFRHGDKSCVRDECGHFWCLDDLERCKEDPVCAFGSVVATREFPLKRVKPWIAMETDRTNHPATEQTINNLDTLKLLGICKKLDIFQVVGRDFRELAGHFGIPWEDLALIEQQSAPTSKVLRWAAGKPCNTIAKLREILVKMERFDCVKIID